MSDLPPLRGSWLSSDRRVPRLIARPVRTFLQTEAAGGIVLLAAALVALIWANSPLRDGYAALWETEFRISIGSFELAEDLRHWVNDALMALFFFVVGLEIKRELVTGELNDARKASLPAIAALGGMVGPALLYLAFNVGGPGVGGWGIPMATDIAFAVGVLALLSDRVPTGLKVFLLSLAIVDVIGAILVIALFYSSGLQVVWLATAAALIIVMLILRRVRVVWVPVYVVIGTGVWLAMFSSGVHATIAGVALGLLTPALPTDPGGFSDVLDRARGLSSEPDAQSLREITMQGNEVVSVAERLEHLLHPWTSFVVVPVFALANAGVTLSGGMFAEALGARVALGIIVGLVVGKIVGISGASWVAVRLGLGRLPDGMEWSHVIGGAAVAGIGFTVSLFVTGLAFDDPALVAPAKLAILIASVVAGTLGAATLLLVRRRSPAASGADDL
ncbi:MAG: Na+/H+ antiporter NhaA [Actinomycetota bacterium]